MTVTSAMTAGGASSGGRTLGVLFGVKGVGGISALGTVRIGPCVGVDMNGARLYNTALVNLLCGVAASLNSTLRLTGENAGWRDSLTNVRLGGAASSLHLRGSAADFTSRDYGPRDLAHAIGAFIDREQVPGLWELIYYLPRAAGFTGWVHLGFGSDGRTGRRWNGTVYVRIPW
jgi:hypothetical protein